MKIGNYYIVKNWLSYQMMCLVSLHQNFGMNYAGFLIGMVLQNNGKWTRVKDAYLKQKCKVCHKAKVQICCSCTGEFSMCKEWYIVHVLEV